MKNNHISSGISYLDKISGGFLVGDNVIWRVESGSFVELFYLNFIKSSLRNKKKVVFINFNSSPKTILKRLGSLAHNEKISSCWIVLPPEKERSRIYSQVFMRQGRSKSMDARLYTLMNRPRYKNSSR